MEVFKTCLEASADHILRNVVTALPNTACIRNYKRRISLDPKQPEGVRKEMERQLAIPMKYKQVEVIEMDTVDDAPL